MEETNKNELKKSKCTIDSLKNEIQNYLNNISKYEQKIKKINEDNKNIKIKEQKKENQIESYLYNLEQEMKVIESNYEEKAKEFNVVNGK